MKLGNKEHEDKCDRCASCCRVVIETGGERIPMKCEFLNDSNECSVYSERPKWCLNPGQMEEQGVMPVNCAYNDKEVI